jgi:hypothetical protein
MSRKIGNMLEEEKQREEEASFTSLAWYDRATQRRGVCRSRSRTWSVRFLTSVPAKNKKNSKHGHATPQVDAEQDVAAADQAAAHAGDDAAADQA